MTVYEDRPSRADLVAHPGDVMFARMAGTRKVFVVDEHSAKHVYSTGFAVLSPDPATLDPDYLKHWLRTPELQSAKDRFSSGATQRAITNSGLTKLTIPLPAIGDQRRIADILDRAYAIRAKRRRILERLDGLPRAVFHSMFGNEGTAATVADVATRARTGPFGSQLLHGEFVDEGVDVLGLDNVVGNKFRWAERRYITRGKYEQLKRYTVSPGDVLISIMGTTGRCVVVPAGIPTAINTKHICAITVDPGRINPQFLRAAFLWHPESRAHLRRQTKGSIMDGLNMGIIKAMPIPVPTLARQEEFADRLRAVDQRHTATLSALAADDELFTSLQARAFRGEL